MAATLAVSTVSHALLVCKTIVYLTCVVVLSQSSVSILQIRPASLPYPWSRAKI